MISYERLYESVHHASCEMRAEALIVQTGGEEENERINHFYRQAAEVWIARCTGALPEQLPQGRYVARLWCEAEAREGEIVVRMSTLLCRRGRRIAGGEEIHIWQMPGGWLSVGTGKHEGVTKKRRNVEGNGRKMKAMRKNKEKL